MAANDGMNASGNANQNGERPIQLAQANLVNNAGGNGPNVIHVAPPAPGAREDITVLPGQNVVLDGVDLATARVERLEGGLLITLADGGVIFLAGFVEAANSSNPPHVEIPGLGSLEAGQLLAAADNNVSNIQPAAGPGAGPAGGLAHGGGANFADVNPGSIGDGLARGPLGPQYDNNRTPPDPQFALGTVTTPAPDAVIPPPTIEIGRPLPFSLDESNLTAGTNNGIPGSTPNLANTHETVDYSTVFTTSGGTSTSYALHVPGGNGSASGLTDSQSGSSIVLVLNGNTVEGHVGSTGGALAFTLAIDPNTGAVTLTQDRAVSQGTASSPDTSEGSLISAGVITLTATVTGPGGSASATVDVGHQVTFLDDGPSIFVAQQGGEGGPQIPTLSVDESNLPTGSAPDASLTHTSASFAPVFTVTTGADNGTTAYALSVSSPNVDSGLVDSVSGQHVLLAMSGGVVEGRTQSGHDLVFTLAVDSSGNVTLTEFRAVKEGIATDGDTNEAISIGSGLISLTGTVTDRDGDTAHASVDVGHSVQFHDDGPSISLNEVELPTLTVDESNLTALTNGIDGSTPNLAATTTTADFSGVFSGSAGADGGSVTGYTLTITGGDGTASGLTDSQTGSSIVLVNNAGTIEGHVGATDGALAFTVSVDASGTVTLTQDRAVSQADGTNPDHSEAAFLNEGVISLGATITDNDGDTATANVDLGSQISFLDDGPSVTADTSELPTLSVDESNLPTGTDPNSLLTSVSTDFSGVFHVTPGADNAGTTAYTLSINGGNGTDSGLVDSVSGQNVVLVMNGTTLEGHTAVGNDLVFTLAVDSSGNVTLTQDRAVHQGTGSSPDNSEGISINSNLVSLTATVTDNDSDSSSASIDLGSQVSFLDDGPSIVLAQQGGEGGFVAPSLSVDESNLPTGTTPGITTSSGSFAGAFTVTQGADTATTAYSLTIDNTASGLVDSVSNQNVVLSMNGTTVEGRTATGHDLVFSLSIDTSTGNVTLTEFRAVKEATATLGDTDESVSLASGIVSVAATVTDKDGDTASQSVDLGSHVSFHDDGPSIVLTQGGEGGFTAPSLSVDESNLPTGTTPGTTTSSGSFAGAFTVTQGADTATTAYSLTIDNTASGLVDSVSNQNVVLSLNAGVIEGRTATGHDLVFTLSIDTATGNVTLTEFRAVKEATATLNDTDETISIASGIVSVTATATDKDGDTATQSVDLGSHVSFHDDGPSISLNQAFSAPSLSVDESNLPTGTTPGTTTSSGIFAGAFTVTQGADTATTAYSLTINNTTSGLVDSQTNQSVVLSMNGTTVEGHVSGSNELVFSLAINTSTGNVTLTEFRAVKEATATLNDTDETISIASGIVSVTATATDKDGDTATQSVDLGSHVSFHDDGPTVSLTGVTTPPISVDESFLPSGSTPNATNTHSTVGFAGAFSVVQGADTATTAYSLTITGGNGTPSGLVDSASNQSIVLVLNGNTVEGHIGTTGGTTAFTIAVDPSTGAVTLTEFSAVKQGTASAGDTSEGVSLTSGILNLVATATDKDGDTAANHIDLGAQVSFLDDGPVAAQVETASLMNQAGATATAALDWDVLNGVANNFGADGGSIKFSSSLDNTASGFTSGGQAVRYSVSADGQTLTGFIDANNSGTFNAGDTTVFTIHLNGTSTYTTTMVGTIDGGSQSLHFFNNGYSFVGGNDPWAGFIDATSAHQDLLLTPTLTGQTVNTNATSGGVDGGNSVGSGEGVRLDFVTHLLGDPAKAPGSVGGYTNIVNDDHTFSGHYTINGAAASFTNITSGTTILIAAYDDHDTTPAGVVSVNDVKSGYGTDRTLDIVSAVGISFNGSAQVVSVSGFVAESAHNVTVGGHVFTITTHADGTYTIAGVSEATQITTFTASGYNSIEYTWAGGDTFKIGGFGTTTTVAGQSFELNPTLTITDGDGDTATSTLHVNLMPDSTSTQDFSAAGSGVTATSTGAQPSIIGSAFGDTLNGDANANDLFGGAGNDTINGGAGADKLYGGSGNDLLIYDAADTVLDGGTGSDTLQISSATADLTALGTNGNLRSIEVVDLKTDSNANTLTINVADVLQADNHTLTVFGGANDTVNAGTGWTAQPQTTVGGVTVDVYTQSVNGVTATLQVEHQINHTIA